MGLKDPESLIRYLELKSKDPSAEGTCHELEAMVKQNQFVMAYFGDVKDEMFTLGFQKEADLLADKISYIQLSFQICPSFFNLETLPGIIFFKDFGNQELIF